MKNKDFIIDYSIWLTALFFMTFLVGWFGYYLGCQ